MANTVAKQGFKSWHDLTAPEIARVAPQAVVILPIGATEQHGPHLPCGTDTMIADAILRQLHLQPPAAGLYLRLPTLAIGASDHHSSFGGTVSLPAILFAQVLVAQMRCLAEQGHKRILLFNAHGGNIPPMHTALAEVAVEFDDNRVIAAGLSYWQLAEADWSTIPEVSGRSLSHACEFETSMIYAARPDLDRKSPPPKREWNDSVDARCRLALPFSAMTPDGAFGEPGAASERAGQQLINGAAASLRTFLEDFSTYDAARA